MNLPRLIGKFKNKKATLVIAAIFLTMIISGYIALTKPANFSSSSKKSYIELMLWSRKSIMIILANSV